MPPVIGIAGGIGSGKSAVARVLAALGCVVSDSDGDARAALKDPAIIAELVEWWGEGILDAGGAVDRRAVGRIVFSDPAERKRLEGLTHPWIEDRRRERFASAPADVPALVIDAPLLFEAGLDRECSHVIFVDVPREMRLARVAERGWDEAELDRREAAQQPLEKKRAAATHVVPNDGSLADLEMRVRAILAEISGSG